MEQYKKPYFTLFSASCDTIEILEKLLAESSLSAYAVEKIQTEIHRLKSAQQMTEEQLIAE